MEIFTRIQILTLQIGYYEKAVKKELRKVINFFREN
jgi:hypothetical protein